MGSMEQDLLHLRPERLLRNPADKVCFLSVSFRDNFGLFRYFRNFNSLSLNT